MFGGMVAGGIPKRLHLLLMNATRSIDDGFCAGGIGCPVRRIPYVRRNGTKTDAPRRSTFAAPPRRLHAAPAASTMIIAMRAIGIASLLARAMIGCTSPRLGENAVTLCRPTNAHAKSRSVTAANASDPFASRILSLGSLSCFGRITSPPKTHAASTNKTIARPGEPVELHPGIA